MGILIDKETRVLVQGITGKQAMFHTKNMLAAGTKIVGGVTPGKGGQTVLDGIPVFNTMQEAIKNTQANASVIFVPARFAADSIMEAVEAEIELVVCISEHIPVQDMLRVRAYMQGKKTRLIGPNCPGILTAEACNIGIIPAKIQKKGHIGIVSRSGTLTYEAMHQMSINGLGETTVIGIGGDPIKGTDFIDCLKLFNADDDTKAVFMIGEIGGNAEEKAAQWIKENMKKPVAAFISGQFAPPGKRMGHAGAIISGGHGSAADKIKALHAAGIMTADTVSDIGDTMVKTLKKAGIYATLMKK